MDKPDGSKVQFAYDADGNRLSKTVISGGQNPTTTVVNDTYALGHLASQSDGNGTLLAAFTYDTNGVPTSVLVGSNPATATRYYYVYNGHGDVVALTDANGNIAATYSYDEFGVLTSSSESFANGWSNPYRYDGRDDVRYDSETGLYWMSVRAYDPALGRFLTRDPLGRAPLFFAEQPYAYAGNNPLVNVDPSGQRVWDAEGTHTAAVEHGLQVQARRARIYWRHPHQYWHSCVSNSNDSSSICSTWRHWHADASARQQAFANILRVAGAASLVLGIIVVLVGSVWLMLNAGSDLDKTIGVILLALQTVALLAQAVQNLFTGSAAEAFHVIYAVLELVVSFVTALAAALAHGGWVAMMLVQGLLVAGRGAAEGWIAPFIAIVQGFVGDAIGYAIVAVGSFSAARGYALLALSDAVDHMSQNRFCQLEFACSAEPANGYMAY